MSHDPPLIGDNLWLGNLEVKSLYDPTKRVGHFYITIVGATTPEQRQVVADMMRRFADRLVEDADA